MPLRLTLVISYLCVLSNGAAAAPSVSRARYLYGLTCDATVYKLDTATEKTLLSESLAKRTARFGKPDLFPVPTKPAPDGCIANQMVYDRNAGMFFTVVPKQWSYKPDSTKDYRVFAFSVPGLRFLKVFPGKDSVSEEPHIDSIVKARPRLTAASDADASQRSLDVSSFGPKHAQLQNRLIEKSGDVFLLDLFDNEFGVANRQTKSLVSLIGLPPGSHDKIHLAPGGAYVLVEMKDAGTLAVYDSKTGGKVSDYPNTLTENLHFLAISPNGKAIYCAYDQTKQIVFKFVDLGLKFKAEPVIQVSAEAWADERGHFFGDQ